MNLSEIIAEVKRAGFRPSEIFDKSALLDDDLVASEMGKLHLRADALETDLTNSRADLVRSKSRQTFEDVMKGRTDLLDQDRKYIERNWKNFTTEATDEEGLKKDLGAFIDPTVGEFRELQKDVGIGLKNPLIPTDDPPTDNPLREDYVPPQEPPTDNPLREDYVPPPTDNPLRWDYVPPAPPPTENPLRLDYVAPEDRNKQQAVPA